jgi:hypothetical protein
VTAVEVEDEAEATDRSFRIEFDDGAWIEAGGDMYEWYFGSSLER